MFKMIILSIQDLHKAFAGVSMAPVKVLGKWQDYKVYQTSRKGTLVMMAVSQDMAIVVTHEGLKLSKKHYIQMKKILWKYMQDLATSEEDLYLVSLEAEKRELIDSSLL